ncbi:MAG: hypothetical protein U0O22_02480 [Acutalibacteraceae bacterium]
MGVRIKFNEDEYLNGLKTAEQNLQEEINKLTEKGGKGLLDALFYVGAESQKRAPKDNGDLRGSLQVELGEKLYAQGVNDKGNNYVEIVGKIPEQLKEGKVSFNTEYAATQHEQINYHHENGQAKYLESVLIESQERILNCIAGKIKEEWGAD